MWSRGCLKHCNIPIGIFISMFFFFFFCSHLFFQSIPIEWMMCLMICLHTFSNVNSFYVFFVFLKLTSQTRCLQLSKALTKFSSIDGASKQTIFHFHYFCFRLAQYASRFSLALDHWHICSCHVDKATPSASRLFDLIYCNERDFDWYSNQRYKDS